MDYKKDLLLRSSARLCSLDIEIERARQHLRELVDKSVPYTSIEMRKALEKYQVLGQQWRALEQEFLRLKEEIDRSK